MYNFTTTPVFKLHLLNIDRKPHHLLMVCFLCDGVVEGCLEAVLQVEELFCVEDFHMWMLLWSKQGQSLPHIAGVYCMGHFWQKEVKLYEYE